MELPRNLLLAHRHRLLVLALLVLSTSLSLGLLIARWMISGKPRYGFLIWNLFLAWIPFWLASTVYYGHPRHTRRNVLLGGLGAMWLLFFPNAPYLWTDLVHLFGAQQNGTWWCDLVMWNTADKLFHPFAHPLPFAIAALFFAFLSLAYLTLLALMEVGRVERTLLVVRGPGGIGTLNAEHLCAEIRIPKSESPNEVRMTNSEVRRVRFSGRGSSEQSGEVRFSDPTQENPPQ